MPEKKPRRRRLLKRVLRALLLILSAGLLTALFFVTVLLAGPRPEDAEETPAPAAQPLVSASPAFVMQTVDDLRALIAGFPVPVLASASADTLTLISGGSADQAYEGGFGRTAILVYRTADGSEVRAMSLYPRRALSLLPTAGWHVVSGSTVRLSGMDAAVLTNGSLYCLQAASDSGLYTVTLPVSASGHLSEIASCFTLYTAN